MFTPVFLESIQPSVIVDRGTPKTFNIDVTGLLRIWAVVVAIEGTDKAVFSFERGIFNGETKEIFKQLLLIISAIAGTQTGALFINWLTQEHIIHP